MYTRLRQHVAQDIFHASRKIVGKQNVKSNNQIAAFSRIFGQWEAVTLDSLLRCWFDDLFRKRKRDRLSSKGRYIDFAAAQGLEHGIKTVLIPRSNMQFEENAGKFHSSAITLM